MNTSDTYWLGHWPAQRVVLPLLILAALTTAAEARSFNCGRYMRGQFGIADRSLDLALNWARKFQHTTPSAGAVVVQRRKGRALGGGPGGHVSKIVRVIDGCRAVVQDNRGVYERNICKNLVAYVRP